MSCFVETSDLEVSQSGDRLFMIDKVIPDATMTSDTTLSVELLTNPLVVMESEILKVTAAATNRLHVTGSFLEVTNA